MAGRVLGADQRGGVARVVSHGCTTAGRVDEREVHEDIKRAVVDRDAEARRATGHVATRREREDDIAHQLAGLALALLKHATELAAVDDDGGAVARRSDLARPEYPEPPPWCSSGCSRQGKRGKRA